MNKSGKILLADDEPDILEIVSYNLIAEGYEVICAKNGSQAIEMAKEHLPSMIILDVMMPGKNGIEVCRILRSEPKFKDTVIIFLSAMGDERSEIRGLETGADDYITKPISPKVLTSKVNALFRRVTKDEMPVLQLGDLLINREKYNVTYKDHPVTLARKEFELLSLLASKPGKVFLRNEILEKVWGTDVIVGDRTIDVHVRKIRQKIGVDCISTVKGVGYKFEL
jgi:two-component system alkaline phosphatase synthesis response regulator PhoP